MKRIKQVGSPVVIVALIAGLIGYIVSCARTEREQGNRAQAQAVATTDEGATKADEPGSQQPNVAVAVPSPVGTMPDRDTYFPGTEAFAKSTSRQSLIPRNETNST